MNLIDKEDGILFVLESVDHFFETLFEVPSISGSSKK
jgi:hypothetical protein